MIDYDKLQKECHKKYNDVIKNHHQIIENKISQALALYDARPSQIELRIKHKLEYEILIKADKFAFDYVFTTGLEE